MGDLISDGSVDTGCEVHRESKRLERVFPRQLQSTAIQRGLGARLERRKSQNPRGTFCRSGHHISGDTSGDTSVQNLLRWFAIDCNTQLFTIKPVIIGLREYATTCILLQSRQNRT